MNGKKNLTEIDSLDVDLVNEISYDLDYYRKDTGKYVVKFETYEHLGNKSELIFNITVTQGIKEINKEFKIEIKEATTFNKITLKTKTFLDKVYLFISENKIALGLLAIALSIFGLISVSLMYLKKK